MSEPTKQQIQDELRQIGESMGFGEEPIDYRRVAMIISGHLVSPFPSPAEFDYAAQVLASMQDAAAADTRLNWEAMPGGKAKYHAYLASREWALLKSRVRRRSGGCCEHCRSKDASQVHHQTYERIYAEQLTDLLHVCESCHRHLSGK